MGFRTDGRSWGKPVAMKGAAGSPDPHHVEPKLFLLDNGVLVLSSGRAGCYVWTLPVAQLLPGQEGAARWTGFNLLAAHNQAAKTAVRNEWIIMHDCSV